jgi:hypothetical protein
MKMFKAVAAVAALGVCAVASAQKLDTTPTGISVKAGVSISMDSTLSDSMGSSLISLGVEYQLGNLFKSGETYLSLDYLTKSIAGSKGSIIPITVNQRWYMKKNGTERRTYGFLGLGIAVVDVVQSGTALCFRGGLGVELGAATFAEVAVTLSEATNNVKANTVGLYFGYRF